MKRPIALAAVAILATSLSSCAIYKRDRCYIAETRYMVTRALFEQTGSYQRVAQEMHDEQWARCEINQFRYRLRKDLALEGPEYDFLFKEYEPNREDLEFYPGKIEKAVGL